MPSAGLTQSRLPVSVMPNLSRGALLTLLAAQYLEQRQATQFDPNDSHSLELKYGAKLLYPTNCYT